MASVKLWCSNCGQMNRFSRGSFEIVKSGFLFSPSNARYTTEVLPCQYCKGEWLQTNSKARGDKAEKAAIERMEKEGHNDLTRLRLGKR